MFGCSNLRLSMEESSQQRDTERASPIRRFTSRKFRPLNAKGPERRVGRPQGRPQSFDDPRDSRTMTVVVPSTGPLATLSLGHARSRRRPRTTARHLSYITFRAHLIRLEAALQFALSLWKIRSPMIIAISWAVLPQTLTIHCFTVSQREAKTPSRLATLARRRNRGNSTC